MIEKKDGIIDWNRTARQIDCQIRGLNPWPSAFTGLESRQLKIWRASVSGEPDSKKPCGTVLGAEAGGIRVQTGEGILILEEIQLEGRKRMTAADFLRGRRFAAGETRLGF